MTYCTADEKPLIPGTNMEVKNAYNIWAAQYDTNSNKTRDLEAISLRSTLADFKFQHCLEIGCGTGKNTGFLLLNAQQVTAVDFSEEMLKKAKEKIKATNVQFVQADITKNWAFIDTQYDLVTFSLVLEHIENIEDIFRKLSKLMPSKGLLYIGELHPFKQYTGSKARFDTKDGQTVVPCFNHHISDFTTAAKNNDFKIAGISEYFDDDDRNTIPRILTLLFEKK
jgi:ubiquinone/menaquinone biosynthesis C-methylase UbiE